MNISDQFINPKNTERGMPFWAWNCKLTPELLMMQIPCFKYMGMGGFIIHSRTGMTVPYLGEEYMKLVKMCVDKAREDGMSVILYDEDRWPSGFGGGMITKDKKYRARYLVFSRWADGRMPEEVEYVSKGRLDIRPWGGGRLLYRFKVETQDGYLKDYHILDDDEAEDDVWYLHEELMHHHPWFNNQTYMDTLNPNAVKRMLEMTYEHYEKALGDMFGTTAKAMFTDEPQFIHKHFWSNKDPVKWAVLPFSEQIETTFQEVLRLSFLKRIPELFWDRQGQEDKTIRYGYHRTLLECFAENFCDTLGTWCEEHRIALTGHMKGEGTLALQAGSTGETMRNYRNFQIPGIDMLCDKREYTTAKQAQSAARQMGSADVMSELYGVTNWDFDFKGHKLQGDWQAALGVTLRVPHLAWASMEGEAKRDFPASIFYQSPWYVEYQRIETYFARINTVMKTGKPVVNVAVVHPIESLWLDFGLECFGQERQMILEEQFQNLAQWLLFGCIDFDYISEALLEQQTTGVEKGALKVGSMVYEVIIVPGLRTIRSETLKLLEEYKNSGGFLLFVGAIPEYIDGRKNHGAVNLANRSAIVPFIKEKILDSLLPFRRLWVSYDNGVSTDKYLYQLRKSENDYYLFMANGKNREAQMNSAGDIINITIKGTYNVEQWNPMDGSIVEVPAEHDTYRGNAITCISHRMYEQDSLLLHLYKSDICRVEKRVEKDTWNIAGSLNLMAATLKEPNVLILDQAEFCLNNGKREPKEEVLRIENTIRKRLGYPLKTESFAQPWTEMIEEKSCHQIELWYFIESDSVFESIDLAVEAPGEKEIWWNGELCSKTENGWYVDPAIIKVKLGTVREGKNELYIKQSFKNRSNLEWCFLLGDFNTQICRKNIVLAEKKKPLEYGDITDQGLMFYGGNIEYNCEVQLKAGRYVMEVSKFKAPVLGVKLDGMSVGIIAFEPYRIDLGCLEGKHCISIIAYGNRFNTFGALHNCKAGENWFGPSAWRTAGKDFTYGYQIRPAGVLEAPILYHIS